MIESTTGHPNFQTALSAESRQHGNCSASPFLAQAPGGAGCSKQQGSARDENLPRATGGSRRELHTRAAFVRHPAHGNSRRQALRLRDITSLGGGDELEDERNVLLRASSRRCLLVPRGRLHCRDDAPHNGFCCRFDGIRNEYEERAYVFEDGGWKASHYVHWRLLQAFRQGYVGCIGPKQDSLEPRGSADAGLDSLPHAPWAPIVCGSARRE